MNINKFYLTNEPFEQQNEKSNRVKNDIQNDNYYRISG